MRRAFVCRTSRSKKATHEQRCWWLSYTQRGRGLDNVDCYIAHEETGGGLGRSLLQQAPNAKNTTENHLRR